MFLSNPAKNFLALVSLIVFLGGCGTLPSGQNTARSPVADERSEFPFETKEPEIFQCEIVVTAGAVERKTFVTRKNGKQRIDFDLGTEKQHSIIKTDKEALLSEHAKIYAEKPLAPRSPGSEALDDYTSLLLNRRDFAEFEEAGRENNLTIFRATIDQSHHTEVLIYIDHNISLPVKQEFFSIAGDQWTLQYSVEMRNFSTEVADNIFQIPRGMRKVPLEEFYRMVSR